MTDAHDLAFGKQVTGLLLLLGHGMQMAARRQAGKSASTVLPGDELLSTEAQREAILAAQILVERFAVGPMPSEADRGTMGEVVAAGLLDWLEKPSVKPHDNPQWTDIRERLAPLLKGAKG